MRGKLLLAVVAVVVLAACGGSKTSTTGTTVDRFAAPSYGNPGVASAADRTVAVNILPSLKYDPAAITVSPGETVTFKVTNMASDLHEFVLGDSTLQDDFESEMRTMASGAHVMPDTSNTVDVAPGETKELTWHFLTTAGATVIYGSHEPGDYTGGLRGVITVSTSSSNSTSAP